MKIRMQNGKKHGFAEHIFSEGDVAKGKLSVRDDLVNVGGLDKIHTSRRDGIRSSVENVCPFSLGDHLDFEEVVTV